MRIVTPSRLVFANAYQRQKHPAANLGRNEKAVLAIVKYTRPRTYEEIREDYIRAMWLLYRQVPGRETRDESGALDLGEVGATKSDHDIKRWCPYSICEGIKK